jgi:MFS family permease
MATPGRPARRQLAFAAAGVLLAAADTYVVVVALPAVMTGVAVGLDQLQRATPVITGFLLGYVAVLPLLGRLTDLAGKRPVFTACLVLFAAGSVVTASAQGLGLLVAGRAVQGLGGGGLVPVTLGLVAEQWPAEQRSVPLGLVGAIQELGSVVGPLYGAVIVAGLGWRWIFWLNLPLAAVVGAGFMLSRPAAPYRGAGLQRDIVGGGLALLAAITTWLALAAPGGIAQSASLGRLYSASDDGPSSARLTTPAAFIAAGLILAFLVWEAVAPRRIAPIVDLRRMRVLARDADLPGAALLAGILACIVIVCSTSDPSRQVVASSVVVLGPLAAVLAVALVWRQRTARRPLLAGPDLAARPVWGAVAVNLLTGAALVAALIGIPLFARSTRYPDSQVGAALVLLRLLAAVPFGAVAGGIALRRGDRTARRGALVAGGGLILASVAFATMTRWSARALDHSPNASDLELVVAGLGFGLAIAPVNAAVLASVPSRAQGLASSLAVVARTIGMLVGSSVLVAIGLHRFYRAEARIPSPIRSCPTHPLACPVYERASTAALLSELHVIFAGAGICALAAALLCPLLTRGGRSPT